MFAFFCPGLVIHRSSFEVLGWIHDFHQGPVSWRLTTIKWQQFSQSNRHSTIGTRQNEYNEALPSSANVQSHLTSLFDDDGNASWYLVCRVRWWNDGWTVKTVVTWRLSASMIPAPDVSSFCSCLIWRAEGVWVSSWFLSLLTVIVSIIHILFWTWVLIHFLWHGMSVWFTFFLSQWYEILLPCSWVLSMVEKSLMNKRIM